MPLDDATGPHLPGGGAYGRSARKEIRNPVLALPGVHHILKLPADQRRPAGILLRRLAVEADTKAVQEWDRRRPLEAAYWRAVSTYAKHFARAIDPAEIRGGIKVKSAGIRHPHREVPPISRRVLRNPVLGLAAASDILSLPPSQRRAIAVLLAQLAGQAGSQAEEAWRVRKGIMAAYWFAVSSYARHLSGVMGPRTRLRR